MCARVSLSVGLLPFAPVCPMRPVPQTRVRRLQYCPRDGGVAASASRRGNIVGLRARLGHAADSRRVRSSSRRSLGLPWLIGVVVIPLLIAAIGHGVFAQTGAAPVVASSGKPGKPPLDLAPLSIARSGNDITLSGDFPDDSAKAVLTRVLKGALPAGVNIVDQTRINPTVDTLNFSNAGPIFKNSASITDFNLAV